MCRGKRIGITSRFQHYGGKEEKKNRLEGNCTPESYTLQNSMQRRKEGSDSIRRNPKLSRKYYLSP